MEDLIFIFNLFFTEKFRKDLEMEITAGAAKNNFNNLKTYLGLDDLMQATF